MPVEPVNTNDIKSSLNGLKNSIEKGFKNLKTLEITTTVGKVTQNITKTENGIEVDFKDPNSKTIFTKIDLLQGDINNCIDPEIEDGKYASLKDFHEKQVEKGQAIIHKNIDVILKILSIDLDNDENNNAE